MCSVGDPYAHFVHVGLCYDISWPFQQNYPPCSIQQSYQDAAPQARLHRKKQEIWIWYNLLLKLDIPKLRNCARAQHIANSWICFILVVYLLKESNSKPNWSMNISQTSNYFKEPSKRWQLIRYGYFHHYYQILKWNIFSICGSARKSLATVHIRVARSKKK